MAPLNRMTTRYIDHILNPGGIFSKGDGEEIVFCQELRKPAVVGDQSSGDAEIASNRLDVRVLLEVSYRTWIPLAT